MNQMAIRRTNSLPYTCKTCKKSYTSLQLCLSHELEHLTVHEDDNNAPRKANKKRPRRPNTAFLPEETFERMEFKNYLIQAFANCQEGMELSTLCLFYQANPDNLSFVYERIYCDLIAQLNTMDTKWEIQPFGSTVTGLAFKNSDIDLYVNHVDSGDDDGPQRQRFKYVTTRIRKCPKFSNVIPINQANVPIIKCTHVLTGYNIDINLSSKTGVYNSMFIAKLLSFDERIHPLMLIIKIWAKTWDITKQFRVTNYCLILLVIFFLQVCQPSILPSIKSLQEGIPPQIVKGANFACRNAPSRRRRKANSRKNIKNLVKDFFNFYDSFDYENKIICPYLGKILDKKEFLQKKFPEYESQLSLFRELPESSADKTISAGELDCTKKITLQDPFCLNQNKGGNLNDKVYIYIRKLIRHAKQVCSDSNADNQPSYKWLIRLFYDTPDLRQINLSLSSGILTIDEDDDMKGPRPATKSSLVNVCNFTPLEIELSFVRSYLMKHFPQQMFNKMEINKFWVENIVKFIIEVLTVIYKIELTPLTDETPKKATRNEGQSDVHANNKYSINCELHANCDFWSGRKIEVKKGHAAFFQEQIEITKRYETERRGNPTYSTGNLYCKFTLMPKADFSSVEIVIEELLPKDTRSSLKGFFNEFTSRIRLFFKAYFESLIRQK